MKTVIDLDTELTEAAAKALGTKTKKETIHAALVAAVEAEHKSRERRRRLINSLGSSDIADDEVMDGAWR
ncbi:type II toxin-antitoxin system VapB family antitoxin [Microtetraspora glauca]|uniref:Type II toxin-antitoxin system VapB family antitoxin n=1 Tax=Microtetraspora glauca TaxID=1996 RepID=A0ABV3G8M1_MICGL